MSLTVNLTKNHIKFRDSRLYKVITKYLKCMSNHFFQFSFIYMNKVNTQTQ